MEVSPKTENEECSEKTPQIRRSEGGRRGLPASGGAEGDQGFTGPCQMGIAWQVPRQPSARLTHDLEFAMDLWRLRCSVFRETSMAFFCAYFKELNCYAIRRNSPG
jgi:hypothetical protein